MEKNSYPLPYPCLGIQVIYIDILLNRSEAALDKGVERKGA